MSKPAGKCVFCGDRRKLTKGHIWPAYAGRILPSTDKFYHIAIGRTETFTPIAPGPDFIQKTKPGHASTRAPKNTCKVCNNGWMSTIENSARYALTRLFLGDGFILDTVNQRLLASLLCLVSVRVEFSSFGMRAIPDEDRFHLMQAYEPPQGWKIWIGRFSYPDRGHYWNRYNAMHLGLGAPATVTGPEHCNTQVTTLVAGQFCAHMLSSTVWPTYLRYRIPLMPIWPENPFPLDTARMPTIGEADAIWIHEAIARHVTQGVIRE